MPDNDPKTPIPKVMDVGTFHDRTQRDTLQGLVEVDETYVGGRATGTPGRDAEKTPPVAVAVELDDKQKPRRIAMGTLTTW